VNAPFTEHIMHGLVPGIQGPFASARVALDRRSKSGDDTLLVVWARSVRRTTWELKR
jgi:hypothetical protein